MDHFALHSTFHGPSAFDPDDLFNMRPSVSYRSGAS
jgi:hypothetical protein